MNKGQILFLILAQMAILLAYSLKTQYNLPITSSDYLLYYPQYMDINIMVFIGFGLLKVFLKNHSFTSVAYNLLIGVWTIQLALLWNDMWLDAWGENTYTDEIPLGMSRFIMASYTAASMVIAFSACAGLLNSFQLIMMATIGSLLQTLLYAIGSFALGIYDYGGPISIHVFGAAYGLAISKAVTKKDWIFTNHAFLRINRYSMLYALLGVLFLFVYFPSFNGAMALTAGSITQQKAFYNTVLGLVGSTVGAFLMSSLLNHGKFMMEDILVGTFAGGVMMASAGATTAEPYSAILAGNVIGMLSALGTRYITPLMTRKMKWNDSCNVTNSHLIPGILGAFLTCIMLQDSEEGLDQIYGTSASDGIRIANIIAQIGIGLLMGLLGGYIVGKILSINKIFSGPLKVEQLFADEFHCQSYYVYDDFAGQGPLHNAAPHNPLNNHHNNHHNGAYNNDPELVDFIQQQCINFVSKNPKYAKYNKDGAGVNQNAPIPGGHAIPVFNDANIQPAANKQPRQI